MCSSDLFKKDMASKEVGKLVDDNVALAFELGLKSPPAFMINGKRRKSALALDRLAAIVERHIDKADALLKEGVPRSKLHALGTRGAADGKYFRYVIEGRPLPEGRPWEPKPKLAFHPKVHAIEVGSSPRLGTGDEVVIFEWAEFECHYSAKSFALLEAVIQHYGANRASLVFKHYPLGFHKLAPGAAEASLAAHAQGKFWEMHHKLFTDRKALNRSDLDVYAEEIGLDMVRFRKELDEGTWAAQVEADIAMGKEIGVRGTPFVFINGRRYDGPRTAKEMIQAIDKELLVPAEADRR